MTLMGLPTNGFAAEGLPARELIFTREQEWLEFWKAHSLTPAPTVDFSHWQIAAVFLGPKPNPGFRVQISRGIAEGDRIVLECTEWLPDPSMMYVQVVVYPFDVVAVPKGASIAFSKQSRTQEKPTQVQRIEPRTVDTAGLSAPPQAQFVLFSEEERWSEFWRAHSKMPLPEVDFKRFLAAGLPQPEAARAVSVSGVVQKPGEVHVRLTRGGDGAGACRQSLLLMLPRAERVSFSWTR